MAEQQPLRPGFRFYPTEEELLRHEFTVCRVYVVSGAFRAFDRRPVEANLDRHGVLRPIHQKGRMVNVSRTPKV
ncbi:hypothetical protein CRG98_006335 [Punica granatum]|uniref:NAC domain-containing protein n=1 Tax=Punica granatum TaxID=22663 RepID=A0A2I0KY68_PUNGR|nr:hypothetical protein CRG98_006335 [Punica granatum]